MLQLNEFTKHKFRRLYILLYFFPRRPATHKITVYDIFLVYLKAYLYTRV